ASTGVGRTTRIWNSSTGACLAVITKQHRGRWLTFHPHRPLLATTEICDAEGGTKSTLIHILELDLNLLLGQPPAFQTTHYANAKVVLLGDTGVGKSGLSLVLNRQSFAATDSTPGRKVWTFQSTEVDVGPDVKQTRETLLWDLAGQPGY